MNLLLGGKVGGDPGAAFGKYFVSEFGEPPYDGEDDALSDQNTENVTRNLSTIRGRV